jgi:hypothetical protein
MLHLSQRQATEEGSAIRIPSTDLPGSVDHRNPKTDEVLGMRYAEADPGTPGLPDLQNCSVINRHGNAESIGSGG